jgi:ABC-type branched-subunit amino acid transport system ATPase component
LIWDHEVLRILFILFNEHKEPSSPYSKDLQEGVTVLLVEQNVNEALILADRAYVLENGRVTMEGTGRVLLQNDHVREAYLGI